MNRFAVALCLSSALLGTFALGGCKQETTVPATALTAEPFFIRGSVTRVGAAWGYLVEGVPGTSYTVDRAYFTVIPTTEFRRADGGSASVADLVVGRKISLWITGIIRESYPVQVDAQVIVIE